MNDVFANYVRDLGFELKALAQDAKEAKESSVEQGDRLYQTGHLMGLHEAVSLMLQQAKAFGISAEDVGLAGIDPDRDFL
jgi:hypothetical protein